MGAGRLAPSPTGAQHIGNARTFLLAYWSARAQGLRLILRIEDIDSPRVKPWAAQQAIDDLHWLGIEWDEGPDVGGPLAPYVQTQRTERYRAALERLIADNRAYPCTCTRKDVQEAGSAPHFDHEPKIYPGTCAHWQEGDPLPSSEEFCWRFRVSDREVRFDDAIAGPQNCVPARHLGDFPITQKNDSASYQLAVVVDDGEMGITEVVRGDDLIPSTFRQIELFHALGYRSPQFVHVPLVLGPDGRRLAKRHGDTRLSTLREQGIRAEQIVRWVMASCNLSIDKPISRNRSDAGIDACDRFDWSKIPTNPIAFECIA